MDLLIFGLVVGAVYYSWMKGDSEWKTTAEELGLSYTGNMSGKKLRGRLRGFDVEVEEDSGDSRGKGLKAKVFGVNPGFTLGPERAFQRMIKPDIETGDQIFDERTRIEGDPDWALALLGADARRVAEMVISGWDGKLDGHTLSSSYAGMGRTAAALGTLIDLAVLLRRPAHSELPKLLSERACEDPSASVRLQAFRRLVSSFSARKETRTAAESLLRTPSAFLRLEACRLLLKSNHGKDDRAAEELIKLATKNQVETSVRRSALEALTHSRHQAEAVPAMSQILRWPNPAAVRKAALEGLIESEAKAELLQVRAESEAEAVMLARGLGRFDSSVQSNLFELLKHPGDRARLEAVKALGEVGDLEAIRELRGVAGQDRLFKSPLAREAGKAIESIKNRFGGSQQGEVSIITVAPLEGAVSPSDDSEEGGEISLTS